MPAYEYAFTVTPGRSSRVRSLTIAGAAIAAVCVLSSTVVMRELVGTPPARAAIAPTTAPTAPTTTPAATSAPAATAATVQAWALEPRWWRGEIRQIVRSAPTAPIAPTVQDSELTFTKGYQLRLAARHVGQPETQPSPPAQVAATTPAADAKPARPVAAVRKPTTAAHTDAPARIEGPGNPFARFDVGTRALAYDSQRPSERGVADVRRTPPKGLFGTLY